jgi:alkylation response protein AidB-like acyl-CoA dehydrogenase
VSAVAERVAALDYRDLVVETFRGFFSKECPGSRVRQAEGTGGFDAALWARFGELGGPLVSLAGPEGGGGTLLDAVLVGLEAGRRLAPIAYAEAVAALRLAERAAGPGWSSLAPVSDLWTLLEAPDALVDDGRLTGAVPFSRAGGAAGIGVVALSGGVALVDLAHPSVTRDALPNLGRMPAAAVTFHRTPVLGCWEVPAEVLRTAAAELWLLRGAELVGAGRGALDLALEHVRSRHQFGRPIGSFQAVAHRLADRATALEAAELLLARATLGQGPQWCDYLGAAGLLQAADAADAAARESLQFFGGYGFTLEYDIHLHVRFIKSLRVLACTPAVFAAALPKALGDPGGEPEIVLDPRPERAALRRQALDFAGRFVSDALVERVHRDGTLHDGAIHRAMGERGWIAAFLPPELGGAGLSMSTVGALWEVMYYAGVPMDGLALTEIAAYAIWKAGTPEQHAEYLEPVLRGERLISLGYTEADAGSDVAAAKTRAEATEGGYLVNGAKMFTTMAHVADHVLLLCRTDPAAPKHRGLSLLLVPLDAPGVEIAPVATFGGERTNATFYHDVFVPTSARLGDENDGWSILMGALAVERAVVGVYTGQARAVLDDLVGALRAGAGPGLGDAHVRRRLAVVNARLQAAVALVEHVCARLDAGAPADVEAAMAKLFVTEALKDLTYEALDLAGPGALVERGHAAALAGGRLEHMFRHAQITTIYGGSNEMQRNIIAGLGLRLPKSS